MRKFLLLLALLVLAASGGVWYWWVQQKAMEHIQDTAKRVADVDLQAELDVDLSLKGITLSQGEKGEMHWQLKAKQASYVQEEDTVEVTEPTITYRVGQGDKVLTVQAPLGAIRQKDQNARLWPKVRAVYEQNVLTAGELVYDGKQRILALTNDVTLSGPRFECHAATLRYLLEQDMILVENGVNATVYVDAAFMEQQGVPEQ